MIMVVTLLFIFIKTYYLSFKMEDFLMYVNCNTDF